RQETADEDRRPHVIVELARTALPRVRREDERDHDREGPLSEHERGEHAIGAPQIRVVTIAKELIRARGDGIGGRAHPNVGLVARPACSVSATSKRCWPTLSPSWPRAAVIPPENTRWPFASYAATSPETCAPNVLARSPFGSETTVTSSQSPTSVSRNTPSRRTKWTSNVA